MAPAPSMGIGATRMESEKDRRGERQKTCGCAAQECFARFNQCPQKILSVIGSGSKRPFLKLPRNGPGRETRKFPSPWQKRLARRNRTKPDPWTQNGSLLPHWEPCPGRCWSAIVRFRLWHALPEHNGLEWMDATDRSRKPRHPATGAV